MPHRAAEAASASRLFKLLSHPTRVAIVSELLQSPRSVGELSDRLATPQATVSQHLGVLRQHGLVGSRRSGKRIYYSLASADLKDALSFLCDEFLGRAARLLPAS